MALPDVKFVLAVRPLQPRAWPAGRRANRHFQQALGPARGNLKASLAQAVGRSWRRSALQNRISCPNSPLSAAAGINRLSRGKFRKLPPWRAVPFAVQLALFDGGSSVLLPQSPIGIVQWQAERQLQAAGLQDSASRRSHTSATAMQFRRLGDAKRWAEAQNQIAHWARSYRRRNPVRGFGVTDMTTVLDNLRCRAGRRGMANRCDTTANTAVASLLTGYSAQWPAAPLRRW